jgi:hypothetical protein
MTTAKGGTQQYREIADQPDEWRRHAERRRDGSEMIASQLILLLMLQAEGKRVNCSHSK